MCNVTEGRIALNENHPVIQSLTEDERAISAIPGEAENALKLRAKRKGLS
jgi:hypothetical protein